MKKVAVIGAGFAGLSTATQLAANGYDVTIFEKHDMAGGRARKFAAHGFTFDMGPSWYWMPDVFDNYFSKFGRKVADYYELIRLDPSYKVVFGKKDEIQLPANFNQLCTLFESIEQGSAKKLEKFMNEAQYKYEVGMGELVHTPGLSITEYLNKKVIKGLFQLDLFQSIAKHIRSCFTNDRLIKLLEFPVLFLGATPENTPALYSLMNYADIKLGTWYPKGGMHEIVAAMHALAMEKGVKFEFNADVSKIDVVGKQARSIIVNGKQFETDIVVGAADYHFIEQKLLDKSYRNYSDKYWETRKMAPSSLIYYVGVNKKLKNLLHHNLFFDKDFKQHAAEIYEAPKWPSDPLFYVCCPSVTDSTVAPEGNENLFILIPTAPGLSDSDEIKEVYFKKVIDRLEELTEQSIADSIIYKKSYAGSNFIEDYNAFKGNAYGLANTLKQTAILKPTIVNKKVSNLFYTGQLTVPGPGVPPSIISGQPVADHIIKTFN